MDDNICYIASAGSGKTRLIIDLTEISLERLESNKKIAIITYTIVNQNNIKERIVNKYGYLPENIVVFGWYEFLLSHWIKPYKGDIIPKLYNEHVGFLMVDGQSNRIRDDKRNIVISTYKSGDHEKKYLYGPFNKIYSDKLSEFAFECYCKNNTNLPNRLQNIFQYIYIDECQDLAGYDFEIVKVLLKFCKLKCCLVADPRQCTYVTNQGSKHRKFRGRIDAFIESQVNNKRNKYAVLDDTTLSYSHRCEKEICKLATKLTPEFTATKKCKCGICTVREQNFPFKKGCFLLKSKDIDNFVKGYNPLALTWDKNVEIFSLLKNRMNYGESKGVECNSSIIYPTKEILKWLNNDIKELKPQTKAKFYVALTRARFTASIVVPDNFKNNTGLPFWGGRAQELNPLQLPLFGEVDF